MISKLIPLRDILVDYDRNPRGPLDDASIDELMRSIKAVHAMSGTQKTLLQPVVVRPITHDRFKYELRFGYRRFAAFSKAYTSSPKNNPWAASIDAVIDDHDEDDEEAYAALAFALIENIQREQMSAIDEAIAIKTMVGDFGLKQKDVSEVLGKSKGWVSQRMALTKLDPVVQAALSEGKIEFAHARELIKVESGELQRELLGEALKEGWQLDDWKKNAAKARRGETRQKEEETEEVEEEETTEEVSELPGDVSENSDPSPPSAGGYSVQRSPAEIKQVQEDIEWEEDGDESPYKKGIRDALLWVLGLSEDLELK